MTIQILPPRLANQIAAGEVVERPASVVKELVENSLDAQATAIEIDITQGGHKGIVIRDNGKGIPKQELILALSRHATSKISSLDDLERITSMGFRGEALASISSVSRLTLTSKPEAQSEAWQAKAEGRDMDVTVTPAAHPKGTTIAVMDLFFNTPARRKFLRSEKTELMHIEEVFRRIAISRFDVAFTLKHNGKVIKKYPAAVNAEQQLKRIAKVCHKDFLTDALTMSLSYQSLKISGYILPFEQPQPSKDSQYVYVNGRVMRDRVINHAVRQGFDMAECHNAMFAYVFYLELPPEDVDINVHPAKHEVRFHQGRLIHDFIQRAIRDTLLEMSQGAVKVDNQMHEPSPTHDYIAPLTSVTSENISDNAFSSPSLSHGASSFRGASTSVSKQASKNYQSLVTPFHQNDDAFNYMVVDEYHLLINDGNQFYALPIVALLIKKVTENITSPPVMQPLLMPVAVTIETSDAESCDRLIEGMSAYGIAISRVQGRLILKQVSHLLRELNWSILLPELVSEWLKKTDDSLLLLIKVIGTYNKSFSTIQAQQLYVELMSESPHTNRQWLKQHAKQLPLADWINTL